MRFPQSQSTNVLYGYPSSMADPRLQIEKNSRYASFRVQNLGFGVQGSEFRVEGSGFRVQGSGFRVRGSRFRVQGSGFRVRVCPSDTPLPRRCRAIAAHARQSRPEHGLDFRATVLKLFKGVPFSLGIGKAFDLSPRFCFQATV